MMMLYVAGPITENKENGKTLQENLKQLSDISLELWRMGHAPINPGGNTDFIDQPFNAGLNPEVFYEGDLVILGRCDGVVLTPDFHTSVGASREAAYAQSLGIPVYVWPTAPEPM